LRAAFARADADAGLPRLPADRLGKLADGEVRADRRRHRRRGTRTGEGTGRLMGQPVILAIDQGTTNTKALLVARDGQVLLSRTRPMQVDYPRAGWAEQSASDIWEAVAALIAELVAAAPDATV